MSNKKYSGCFLFVSGLILAFGLGHSAYPDENLYIAGLRAFNAREDLKAAEYMIRAARESARCRAVFEDPLLNQLPSTCLEKADSATLADPAPMVLFQLGRLRWQEQTQELKARGLLRKNQHSRILFEELIKNHPASPYC
jgi:hypothetical protein